MAIMRRITKAFRTRASVDEFRELLEVQEMEGLHLGLCAVEEVPDRRERTGMGHVEQGAGRSLVDRIVFQRTVGAASWRWFRKAWRASCCW